MTPARLRWGLILIQVGVLILLVNLDIINYNFVPDLIVAFPFFLIAIGIEKIFTRSRAEVVSYVAVAALFFGGIYIAVEGSQDGQHLNFFERTSFHQDFDPSIDEVQALVRIGDGDLTVRDVTDDMFYARFAEFTHKPRIKWEVENRVGTLVVKRGSRNFGNGFIKFDLNERDDWTLYFSKVVPLLLKCEGRNADIHLNLATTPLKQLKMDADDSEIYVKIGDLEAIVSLEIEGDGSDVKLRLPSGSAVSINAGEFASYLKRVGFVSQDDRFVSEDFDSLASQIKIDLDKRLDNLKIEFY